MSTTPFRKAFTLIEVLVVVAIIALLVSILLPSLTAAREQAKTVKCAAGLKQISTALGYAYETYRAYPDIDDGASADPTGRVMATWIDVLFTRKYLGDLEVGYCATDKKPDPLNRQRGQAWSFNYPPRLGGGPGADYSYAISVVMSSQGWKTTDKSGFTLGKATPSSLVLAGEGNWNWMHGFGAAGLLRNNFEVTYWGSNGAAYRHGTSRLPVGNFAFADSSVRPVRLDLGDTYPNSALLRGLRTTDKYFWRSGEHTEVGLWNDTYNVRNISGGFYDSTKNEYPLGPGSPKELDPGYYSDTKTWAKTVVTRKGWVGY